MNTAIPETITRHGTPGAMPDDSPGARRQRASEVASKFEALFLKQMVSKMRESADFAGGSGMFGSGPGADTYTKWFDRHMSGHIADNGGVGVKEALMREFRRWKQIPAEGTQEADHVRT